MVNSCSLDKIYTYDFVTYLSYVIFEAFVVCENTF